MLARGWGVGAARTGNSLLTCLSFSAEASVAVCCTHEHKPRSTDQFLCKWLQQPLLYQIQQSIAQHASVAYCMLKVATMHALTCYQTCIAGDMLHLTILSLGCSSSMVNQL